ncbi:sigma-70 family RNA polymerase sigma factor [Myxococcota bacterium]|nr:sigma-70 family RNA polymerase sigma factor [Myxococcota bacterium]
MTTRKSRVPPGQRFLAGIGITATTALLVLPSLAFVAIGGGVLLAAVAELIIDPKTDVRQPSALTLGLFLLVATAVFGVLHSRAKKRPSTSAEGEAEKSHGSGYRELAVVCFALAVATSAVGLLGPDVAGGFGRFVSKTASGTSILLLAAACVSVLAGFVRVTWWVAGASSFGAGMVAAVGTLLPAAALSAVVGIVGLLAAKMTEVLPNLTSKAAVASDSTIDSSLKDLIPYLEARGEPSWHDEHTGVVHQPSAEPTAPLGEDPPGVVAFASPAKVFGRSEHPDPNVARCFELLVEPVDPPPPKGKVAHVIQWLHDSRRVGREAAADAAHQALLNVCTRKPELAETPERLRAYYWRATTRVFAGFRRDPFAQKCSSAPELPPTCSASNPLDEVEQAQAARVVHWALCRLAEDEREILRLHIEEELSFEEIAKLGGFGSKSSVGRKYQSAIDRLGNLVRRRCGA